MTSHHAPPNHPPSWGHPRDIPTLLAPTGVPNASSWSTHTYPAPPTRSCHPPPVSAQQHLPTGSRDTSTLPATTGAPNASSCSTYTYPSAPPARSWHPPPVSAQQHLPPGAHASSAPFCLLADAGALPSSSGRHVPPRSQNAPYIPPTPVFICRQKVKARITSDLWVIGIIVSALHLCSKFTGLGYTVEFESVEGRGRDEFSVEDLKPYA